MSTVLKNQTWLADPATHAVIAALEAAGGAGCARFVGGCVRNAVMDRPIDDIDIATVLTPQQSLAAIEAAAIRAVPTGIEHGTITAIVRRKPFEITTLRRDVTTDGRRAVVAFTTDWSEDAQRRDFTFNALYADAAGQVFDPTGVGQADAEAGRVVFVGKPHRRITEDYLRILRYFRFLAWYGRGEPDLAALSACEELKGGLAQISAERVGKEMLKLLAAPDPRRAVRLMARTGVLAQVLPPVGDLRRFEAMGEADPLLMLAALLPDQPYAAKAAASALRLSNAQADRLTSALTTDPEVRPGMSDAAARGAAHRLGRQAVIDRLQLEAAMLGESAERAVTYITHWMAPPLPVSGIDVLALGVAPGPAVGMLVDKMLAWFVAQDFQPDRAAALAELAALIRAQVESEAPGPKA